MPPTVGSNVKAKDRVGEVIVHDPEDHVCTYKVRFEDGTADWFRKLDVVLPGEEALVEEERKKAEEAKKEEERKAAASKILVEAAKAKDAARCKEALRDGADPDAGNTLFFDYTAIHLFAEQGDVDMVATLLNEYGANVDPRSESMETPLIMAARAKHEKVVELLLDKGADPTAATSYKGDMARLYGSKSAQAYISEMKAAQAKRARQDEAAKKIDSKRECYRNIVVTMDYLQTSSCWEDRHQDDFLHRPTGGLHFPTWIHERIIGQKELLRSKLGSKGELLRHFVSSPYFSHGERLSLVSSHTEQVADEEHTMCNFAWGGYEWTERQALIPQCLIFYGMDGKNLRSIVEEKIPELLDFLAVKVVTVHPTRNAEGMTLTCTNVAGDTIATFGPSEVGQMTYVHELKDRLPGGGAALLLPDGSMLPGARPVCDLG